jgi:hypothetical protein
LKTQMRQSYLKHFNGKTNMSLSGLKASKEQGVKLKLLH